MLARTMFLTVLVGGPLAGTLMGMFADPQMKPPPEPAWRSARPDPVDGQPRRIVELGPQDLSPTWYVDRMPTWKRRAAEREAAAYALPRYADYPAEPATIPPAEPAADQATGRDTQADAGAEANPPLPMTAGTAPEPSL